MNAKELARRLAASEGELSELGETLGVALGASERVRLLSMVRGDEARGLELETLLTFVERAAHGESDLLVERLTLLGASEAWVQLLAVRWSDGQQRKLTVGARTHWGSSRIEAAWPELKPWSRTLAANQPQALRWALAAATDRVTFELLARPPTSGARDEVALRAAIADSPDDVAPRLVFADWLLEQGNPLGELIHLSLSQKPDLKRLRELDESWQRWAGPLEPFTQRQHVKAGFVTEVRMTVPAFEKQGATFFRAHPVRTLSLVTPGTTSKHLERLSSMPALDLVRALKLERSFGPNPPLRLAPLAAGSRFARLEELTLGQVGEGEDDWRELFLGLRAPRLKRVTLRNTVTSASTLRWLALNPVSSGLVEVEESPARCQEPGRGEWAQTFATLADRHPGLERLWLEGHRTLDDDGIAPLFDDASKVSLRELGLSRTAIGPKLLRTLARSPRSTRLTMLTLSVDDSAMVDPLGALLSEPRVPIQWLTVSCDHRPTAERLNAMLQALPPTTSLKRVEARGSMYIAVRRGISRFDVLGF